MISLILLTQAASQWALYFSRSLPYVSYLFVIIVFGLENICDDDDDDDDDTSGGDDSMKPAINNAASDRGAHPAAAPASSLHDLTLVDNDLYE